MAKEIIQNKIQSGEKVKVLDLEKYRLKKKLLDAGVQYYENKAGKFTLWVRTAQLTHY
ncbi:MAG TPA: hypothetical protein PLY93_13670 [Turneriella sp.]|nr:hypothetical protein [Turneriella sp.]